MSVWVTWLIAVVLALGAVAAFLAACWAVIILLVLVVGWVERWPTVVGRALSVLLAASIGTLMVMLVMIIHRALWP